MDAVELFLLNPNVVYLILVFGFLLTIMALISPGTTILEISAFFTLLLAGWGVYHLPINLWALVILTFGTVPFLLAVRKYKHPIYLILSIASLVIGSVYLFQGEEWWQPAVNPFLAIIVSILAGGYVWIIVTKGLEAANVPPAHDLNALIGSTGEAKTDIHRQGSVQVAGELWSAQSEQPIPVGSSVRVIGREGFILLVEENNHHPS
jgi:membrane-bound serine protease (ClpP class)